MKGESILKSRLDALDGPKLRRTLKARSGLDFSSNDYLGFSEDSVLKKRIAEKEYKLPLGATGSRLLRGQTEIHEQAEQNLASFCDQETALLFPSGVQANLGILSGILTENDRVFSDELNHASLIDGIRLSRAKKTIYPHRNMEALRRGLLERETENGLKVIVTESLFSMDGNFAPLRELVALAKEFDALLIVDEAHCTGLYGDFERKKGAGLVQSLGLTRDVFATLHTGGKALGLGGAWISGSKLLRDSVVNFSRPFIFSTGVTPKLALALSESVDYWKENGILRATQVQARARQAQTYLFKESLSAQIDPSPIQSIILGSNERSLSAATKLELQGFDVRAIRPPTVPVGTARLRFTLNSKVTDLELNSFLFALKDAV